MGVEDIDFARKRFLQDHNIMFKVHGTKMQIIMIVYLQPLTLECLACPKKTSAVRMKAFHGIPFQGLRKSLPDFISFGTIDSFFGGWYSLCPCWKRSRPPVSLKMNQVTLLMEEILHHLGWMKPCNKDGIFTISTAAGFFPSSHTRNLEVSLPTGSQTISYYPNTTFSGTAFPPCQ